MSSSYVIASLLEKMTNPDADFRFMAAQDLMLELNKDLLLEDSTETKIVSKTTSLLTDKNAEVQNLAIRCLPLLNDKV
jgi:cullin-associated NEDD8-dissociated protein 1